jgi:hypothetical protein
MANGIPTELYAPLRQALLNCGPFDSNSDLRDVFFNNESLRPWRFHVPEASSRAGRVDKTTAYLVNRRHRNGRNALVLFIRALTGTLDEDDCCHSRLTETANRLESALSSTVLGNDFIPEAGPVSKPRIYIAADLELLRYSQAVALVSAPRIIDGSFQNTISGSGWLITPRLAITSWHVIEVRSEWAKDRIDEGDLREQVRNIIFIFDQTLPSAGTEYGALNLEYYDRRLDYAILRLRDRPDHPLHAKPFITLDADTPLTLQTQLYILQYPQGQVQQRAAGEFISLAPQEGYILHSAPTEGGASGAPLLNVNNWGAVALHNGKQRRGEGTGTLLRAILNDLRQARPNLYQEIIAVQRIEE